MARINTANVGSVVEVARFKLPETTAFQSGPSLTDGTMYVTTATNTYAIDARTAEQRWSHHFDAKSMASARRTATSSRWMRRHAR